MMKLCKVFFLIFFMLYCAGCATAPLNQDVSKDLRASKVAVVYCQKEKRINYNELVYRVLWNESREQDASFDGLWDIDYDLSNYMAPRVAKLGLNVTSVYDLIPEDEINQLHKCIKSTIATEDKKLVKKDLVLTDSLRKALLSKQIDYLMTVDSDNIYVYTQLGVKTGSARTGLCVLDVRSNEQKYFGSFPVAGNFEVEKNAREIENNNLAGLKHMLKGWLDNAIRLSMPKQLGLAEK